ncbi:MAG: type II/IV secretion system ATPase subunit [Nanoarchaeota archaeon]|nr:type II/IV secretion system ATPase subunit [Nanoarchaeota archaeon]MBU1269172.1 type II/IV secretion system ATPase subunit [Nanoarchaeota archaeon]MBU2443051.1 type II/IV secretion system ATPase subunit [Nanoarchaeota archaeon]
MLAEEDLFSFEMMRQGEDNILRINCEKATRAPSIEDDEIYMSKTAEFLIENPGTTKIVFSQKRDYEYDYPQTVMLNEIAHIYNELVKNKRLFSYESFKEYDEGKSQDSKYNEIRNTVFNLLKKDPVGCYVALKRIMRKEQILMEKSSEQTQIKAHKNYLKLLDYLINILENTKLIAVLKPFTAGHRVGSRDIYRKVFSPTIKPDFMFTKLMATYPKGAVELDAYVVNNMEVVIFELPDTIQYLYHITPPEFKLEEEKYELLDLARNIMSEHKPEKQDFVDPQRMREVFYNVGHDLMEELANYKNIKLSLKEVDELTQILIRYTVGFGLIEVLLQDEKIQDITINSPMGQIPMFLVHQDFGDCKTNIIPTVNDGESWASKLRLISGRPLDEANPILDTEIELPGIANSRVGVIAPPLNPTGIAYAFRRHRDKPWTLPLFIKNGMLNPLAAGIISFLIDGNRTLLIAGTRSAGKSSLLGSILVDIMRKYRILTIEDTLELPSTSLRKLGYNIQQLKVASALSKGSSEVPADEGIRTTLRLGDSCLIVGEVRSTEAKALYEAMRVGALSNVVAGTIHGDSPYGVFDRVVNDLEVPRTSFKATDVIIVANPIKSADGLHKWRRITQITEVRKTWEDDPLREGGFVDLMKYNSKTDQLEPSDELINGESEILKAIAGNVKEWAGDWDAVWDNILLRAKIKELIVETAKKENNDEILEAPFVIQSNDQFHRISERIREKKGKLDSKMILFEWTEWLKKEVRKFNDKNDE